LNSLLCSSEWRQLHEATEEVERLKAECGRLEREAQKSSEENDALQNEVHKVESLLLFARFYANNVICLLLVS